MPTVLLAVDGSELDARLTRTTLGMFGDRADYVVVNDDLDRAVADYRRKADELILPDVARTELEEQLRRLAGLHPESAETAVVRTWLDWMTTLPWQIETDDLTELSVVNVQPGKGCPRAA